MFRPADWIKDYDASAFERQALALFDFQYRHNEVYRRFAGLLGRTPQTVKRLTDIPFMPVEFFKAHQVVAAPPPYDLVFQSSGTTGMVRSRHYVKDRRFYFPRRFPPFLRRAVRLGHSGLASFVFGARRLVIGLYGATLNQMVGQSA